jgi:hypothetical protein
MLEGFHSYAQELYLIGKEQDAGSNRQKVPFALAKWFFDTGDRARLTVSTGTPPRTRGPEAGCRTVAALGSWPLNGF